MITIGDKIQETGADIKYYFLKDEIGKVLNQLEQNSGQMIIFGMIYTTKEFEDNRVYKKFLFTNNIREIKLKDKENYKNLYKIFSIDKLFKNGNIKPILTVNPTLSKINKETEPIGKMKLKDMLYRIQDIQ